MNTFDIKFGENTLYSMAQIEVDFNLMCLQFNKYVGKYYVNQEIHSDLWWQYLEEKWQITKNMEGDVIMRNTEVSIDEKNRSFKDYKYYVKILNNRGDLMFYFTFFDEFRNLDDDDYHDFATSEDKTDKVQHLMIYYDPDIITSKWIEDEMLKDIEKCMYIPRKKNQFFTIGVGDNGYQLLGSYIKEMDFNLELNYGKDFIEIDKKIVDSLKNDKFGLFLLHGQPGVGKTSYVRKLIADLSEEKTVIYVPPYMMESIAEPGFMSFISKFKKSILILEDSENIISNTFMQRTQAIANILNMTDGLLNDHLEVQIISTFNTSNKEIDPALLRAGRLKVNYEFKALKPKQANKLCKHLDNGKTFDNPTTLSEIYEGHNQIISIQEKKRIGFQSQN